MRCEKKLAAGIVVIGLLVGAPPHARAQEEAPAAELPGVLVTAPREEESMQTPLATQNADVGARNRALARDGASLLENVPGGAVNRNGSLTGIVQLRGLFDDRVKTLVDGMTITPACSNHMDPPLHYVIPGTVESMRIVAGVTPVSLGGDSIGGTLIADSEEPVFAADGPFRITADANGNYAGSQGAYGFAGTAGIAGRNASMAYTGSWQTGDDLRFPGGSVRDTTFDIQQHGLLLAARHERWGVFSLDGGLGNTDYAGTPALMMDITDDSSRHFGGRWEADLGFAQIEARGYWHHIDHMMDDFTLRPNAGTMMNAPMRSPAESRDAGYRLDATVPFLERHVARVGSDMNLATFDSVGENLLTNQTQTGIPGARRNRVGVYAEWEARWTEQWQTLVGLREDTVWSNAGDATQLYTPMNMAARRALAADAAAFNALDHSVSDIDWEATALLRFGPAAGQRYELGLARKVRAPSMLERFTWTPIMASAGLADGRSYWGNVGLDPETAYQMALTGSWNGEKWRLRVSPFYTHVSEYIQGSPVPGRFDAMTGNAILRWENFANVNLYGVDAEAGYTVSENIAVRGYLSYVRGRNDSTDDDLYRIMPLHGVLDLDLSWRRLSGTVEVALAARQDEVARYNGEKPTAGWAVLNLSAGYALREGTQIVAGVENVFDKRYALHTNGVNRVTRSDVAVGERIPEAGRYFYTGVTIAY